jgi:hypothetical protein
MPVDRMLRNVRDQVVSLAKSVRHDQVPALYDQTIGDFYFHRGAGKVAEMVSVDGSTAPEASSLSLDDLKQEEQRRTDWAAWQTRMQADYSKVQQLKSSADLKAQAWERFLAAYPQDNPYSKDDEQLRQEASKAKRAAENQPVKVAMATPPQSLGRAQSGLIAERYQDNGDGTVTEVSTGLQWKRCAEGQTWTGATCLGNAGSYKWDAARSVSSRFAGHSDWRLPTIDELKRLVYCSSGQPGIWNDSGEACRGRFNRPTIQAEAFPNAPSSSFWSDSPDADGTNYAWFVDLYGGFPYYGNRNSGKQVRLVRGGQ